MELFWQLQFPEMDAMYNIAPTDPVYTVSLHDEQPEFNLMRWGLVPHFSQGPGTGPMMINARIETITEKASFRSLIERRRCLIPADGFIEWETIGNAKQPYLFELNGGEVFAFAGLYDCWTSPDGSTLSSCTIMTCAPNDLLAKIHDRMPVILDSEHFDDYLRLKLGVNDLAIPFPSEGFSMSALDKSISNAKNKNALTFKQNSLFDESL